MYDCIGMFKLLYQILSLLNHASIFTIPVHLIACLFTYNYRTPCCDEMTTYDTTASSTNGQLEITLHYY